MKTKYVKSFQSLGETEVHQVLEEIFTHFGALTPVSGTVIGAIFGILQGDISAFGCLTEMLESAPLKIDPSHIECETDRVTVITRRSGTRITLRCQVGEQHPYSLEVDFGPEGSSVRAWKVRQIFKDAQILFKECILYSDGSFHEVLGGH